MDPATISTRDGRTLAVAHHTPANARAQLVLVHGYAEHRGRYRALIERLTSIGISVHTFDLRGHGESEGARGHVDRFADYLDDLQRVIDTVPNDGKPRILLAHSLGSLIALSYLRTHPTTFDAFAVSSPYLGPAFAVPAARVILAKTASLITPAMPFDSGLDPAWVSRDPEIVDAYRNDPHVFSTATPRWFTEVSAAQEELLAHANEIQTPALFLVAGSDRIADHRIALRFFEQLGSSDKELREYPQLYHEVFNELPGPRETVIQDLLSWLERRIRIAARSAG